MFPGARFAKYWKASMRIAIDCRMIDHSGIGSFTQGVLRNLPRGHEYILYGNPDRLGEYAGEGREIRPCDVRPYSLSELFWLPAGRIDAVFSPSISLFACLRPRERFITVHDVLFLDHPEFCSGRLDWFLKKLYLSISCALTKGVFTVSKFSAERIGAMLKVKRPVHIVPNGLVDGEAYRKSKTIEKEKGSIVFVGNLKKNKNIAVLLEALELAAKFDTDFVLTVIGSDSGLRTSDDETARKIRSGKYGGRIRFSGWLGREEMLECISRAEYLVQPSIYEGFSIVPLEALACGTQPIISDIPVHREIYGQAPVKFFKPKDPMELLALLREKPDTIAEEDVERFIEMEGLTYRLAAERVVGAISGK